MRLFDGGEVVGEGFDELSLLFPVIELIEYLGDGGFLLLDGFEDQFFLLELLEAIAEQLVSELAPAFLLLGLDDFIGVAAFQDLSQLLFLVLAHGLHLGDELFLGNGQVEVQLQERVVACSDELLQGGPFVSRTDVLLVEEQDDELGLYFFAELHDF